MYVCMHVIIKKHLTCCFIVWETCLVKWLGLWEIESVTRVQIFNEIVCIHFVFM